jgi:ClpX C4-type zinc finger
VNEELLDKARNAGARLQEAERDLLLARAEYHTAVRRLHLSGAPLRSMAEALALSHQRVQQIVNSAGGSWWSRVWRTRKTGVDAVCTWCGRPPSEVSKLIAGPNVFICDACTAAAEATASGHRAAPPFTGATKRVGSRCAFCGKGPGRDRRVVTAPQGRICGECLRVCREILGEHLS